MINPETSAAEKIIISGQQTVMTLLEYLIVALVISIIWNMIARKEYEYNKNYPRIYGMSLFPLVGWTVGLIAMMVIYDFIAYEFGLKSFMVQFIVFTLSYWILLISAETIGYHVFNVHNEKAAKYPGLPLLNCLHAPTWMKIAYFSNGIIMFLACKAFGIIGILSV